MLFLSSLYTPFPEKKGKERKSVDHYAKRIDVV
jgi:hypothetical protein